MELQGKVIAVLPARTGTSARGEWMVQEFVIETHETYPHKMLFSVFGKERLERFNIQLGQEIDVFFDIDARSYNDRNGVERWATDIRAYDVRLVDPASIGVMGAPAAAPVAATGVFTSAPAESNPAPVADNPFPPQETPAEGTDDDLPF